MPDPSCVMVTGATGLIGSNVCRLLLEHGTTVRALVRPGSEVEPLAELGVDLVEGDITSADDVRTAAKDCDAIVNSAAVLGGAHQDLAEQRATNVGGAAHAYDTGAAIGARVVELSTTTFFVHDQPLTEISPVARETSDDPYTETKGASYVDAMQRVDDGADIVIVIPGGTYGPAPTVQRAMSQTSFNRAVRAAVRGRITSYLAYPVPWVLVDDVARVTVAAVTKGRRGEKYLAFGAEDAMTTAAFLNVACEVAGVEHRVVDEVVDPDDPAMLERYGPSLVALAGRRYPVPWFRNDHTREQLGYEPIALRDGMTTTIEWLRRVGQLDERGA
jgi:nucleoside-diphosphate-sugar epimerase